MSDNFVDMRLCRLLILCFLQRQKKKKTRSNPGIQLEDRYLTIYRNLTDECEVWPGCVSLCACGLVCVGGGAAKYNESLQEMLGPRCASVMKLCPAIAPWPTGIKEKWKPLPSALPSKWETWIRQQVWVYVCVCVLLRERETDRDTAQQEFHCMTISQSQTLVWEM